MRKGDRVKNVIGRTGTVVSPKPFTIPSAGGLTKFVTVEWDNPHGYVGGMRGRVPVNRLTAMAITTYEKED
jgi:hypothetical protein